MSAGPAIAELEKLLKEVERDFRKKYEAANPFERIDLERDYNRRHTALSIALDALVRAPVRAG